MTDHEHSDVDWAQQPAGGWGEFVAARERFVSGRAWDSLVWRLERMSASGEPAVEDLGGGAGTRTPPGDAS